MISGYSYIYGGYKLDYFDIIVWVVGMVLENIVNSDVFYYNVEYMVFVILVG